MRKLLLLTALFAASPARADYSVGADYTTGNGYRGFDAKASADLDKDRAWGVNAEYAYAHSIPGTESRSGEIVLGLDHRADDRLSFRSAVTGWHDSLNNVSYVGPSFGLTYRVPTDDSERPAGFGTVKAPEEAFAVSFDNDLFYYQTGVNSSSTTIKVRGKPFVVPPLPNHLNVTQWHPVLSMEKPLFGQTLVPSITVGHYFYSRSPTVIEQRSGQPRFSASAGSMTSLAGGFFSNNGTAALDVVLPLSCRLHGALSAEQSATDQTWAVTQEVSARSIIADTLKLTATWDRTLQAGQHQDLWSAGLQLFF